MNTFHIHTKQTTGDCEAMCQHARRAFDAVCDDVEGAPCQNILQQARSSNSGLSEQQREYCFNLDRVRKHQLIKRLKPGRVIHYSRLAG